MSKSVVTWDTAISDAEKMIHESKDQGRIRELMRSIETFKYLRDRGDPFPGEVPKRRKRSAKTVA